MVEVAANVRTGEKELRRDWPHEEGLTAGTTKQEGTKASLEPQEKSLIKKDDLVGLD